MALHYKKVYSILLAFQQSSSIQDLSSFYTDDQIKPEVRHAG